MNILHVILYLFTTDAIFGLDCPFGDREYSDFDSSVYFSPNYGTIDSFCLKLVLKSGITRYESVLDAKSSDSVLFSDFSNPTILNYYLPLIPQQSRIWLPVVCTGNHAESCQYDNGNSFLNEFQFAEGHPNITVGPFVYMQRANDTKHFLLYSISNQGATDGYIMQYGSYRSNGCPYGFIAYKDICYKAHIKQQNTKHDITMARKACQNDADGADLAVIKGDDYNYVASNLLQDSFFIGFMKDKWVDGSPITFTNFDFEDSRLGDCVVVNKYSLQNTGNLMPGYWTYANCSDNFSFLCSISRMDINVVTPFSPVCTEPYFISAKKSGYIYSPGNGSSVMNTCVYVVTVPSGFKIIAFAQFQGDANDSKPDVHLRIYDDITDANCYLEYNVKTNPSGSTLTSKKNSIRIVFDTRGKSYYSKWHVIYKVEPA